VVVRQVCVVINNDSELLTIMSRKNNLPGIAMYDVIGHPDLKIRVLTLMDPGVLVDSVEENGT
jgi:hypothetical protein